MLFRSRLKTTARFRLGTVEQHTVYEGEATGTILATNLISKEIFARTAIIYIDSQALIAALTLTASTPGHYLLDIFHTAIAAIKRKLPRLSIHIKWIPAHKGVEGNEKADCLAKEAITIGTSPPSKLPDSLTKTLPFSRSALKQAFRNQIKKETQAKWVVSSRYARMKHTDPSSPSTSYVKAISTLPRKSTSMIMQLRTGHIPLAKYLHCIRKILSLTCPACQQSDETVCHFILHCPAYERARQSLRYNIGRGTIDINRLLTKLKPMKALVKYVAETRRFSRDVDTLSST